MMIESRFGVRLYNAPFAQRDTHLWTVGPELMYALSKHVKLFVGYLFERGLADGRGDRQFNDDVSYDAHLASVGLDTEVSKSLSLHVSYIYKHYLFTTDLTGDPEHFNRRDDSHQGNIELRYKVTDQRICCSDSSGRNGHLRIHCFPIRATWFRWAFNIASEGA